MAAEQKRALTQALKLLPEQYGPIVEGVSERHLDRLMPLFDDIAKIHSFLDRANANRKRGDKPLTRADIESD